MAKPKRSSAIHEPQNLGGESRKNGAQNPDAPLTEMQRLFVVHYVEDRMTQTAAARAAGFAQAGTAAIELLNNPKVQRAVEQRRHEYAQASQVTKKKVIDGFLEAIEMAKQKADPIAAIAGWREVGKMCGFYEPTRAKIEVSVSGQVLIQRMNTMSDEELLKLAEADSSVLEGELVYDESTQA